MSQIIKATKRPFVTVGFSQADYTCTGTNDDATIQRAITYIDALGGGTVYIKEGTYSISSSISLKSNLWIQGAGGNKTILAGSSSLSAAITRITGTSSGSPIHDFKMSDIKLDGSAMPSANNTALKGVTGEYWLRAEFENVWIYNTPATGFGCDFMQQSSFTNCIADTCGNFGGDPGFNGFGQGTGGYEEESIVYVNCYAINCGNNGFLLERQFDVTFSVDPRSYLYVNCYATGNRRGFRNSSNVAVSHVNCKSIANDLEGFYTIHISVLAPPTECSFIGCEARDNGDDGFSTNDDTRYANAQLNGCYSTGNAGYGFRLAGDRSKIVDCFAWNNDNSGIRVHATGTYGGVGVPIGPIHALRVVGNTCWNNGQSGSGDCDGITISGATWNILSADIWGNHCYDDQTTSTQKYGIILAGLVSNLVIFSNETYGNGKGGIYYKVDVSGTAKNIRVLSNISYNNGRASGSSPELRGIHLQGQTSSSGAIDGLIVQANRCYDDQGTKTQTYGISITETVTNALVSDNDTRGNLTAGILNSITSQATNVFRNNKGFNPEEPYALGNITGATTFNRANGDLQTATLTGNVTATITAGVNAGDILTLILTQDGTGGRTITWPSNFKKAGGTLTLSAAASAIDTILMRWDGTNWKEISRAMSLG